jgi:hypothetical protein
MQSLERIITLVQLASFFMLSPNTNLLTCNKSSQVLTLQLPIHLPPYPCVAHEYAYLQHFFSYPHLLHEFPNLTTNMGVTFVCTHNICLNFCNIAPKTKWMESVFTRCEHNVRTMQPLVTISTWLNNDDKSSTIICRLLWMNNGGRLKRHTTTFFHFLQLRMNVTLFKHQFFSFLSNPL